MHIFSFFFIILPSASSPDSCDFPEKFYDINNGCLKWNSECGILSKKGLRKEPRKRSANEKLHGRAHE